MFVYPFDDNSITYIEKQCKYSMPKGTPVGIDSATDKFVPMLRSSARYVLEDQTITRYVSSNPSWQHAVFVDTNTVILAFKGSGGNVYLRAGTLDPTTYLFTWGTIVDTTLNCSQSEPRICKTSTNAFALAFGEASYPYVIAGTVSGTTITLGSSYALSTLACSSVDIACIDTNKFVCIYATSTNWYVRCGIVSGTTISLGTVVTTNDANFLFPSLCKTYTGEFAIASIITSSVYKVWAGTVSGTTITLGTGVSLASSVFGSRAGLASNGNDRRFLACGNSSTGYVGFQAGSISGTTITLGSQVTAYGTSARLERVYTDTYIMGSCYMKITTALNVVTLYPERPNLSIGVFGGYTSVIVYADNLYFLLEPTMYHTNKNLQQDYVLSFASTESINTKYAGVLDDNYGTSNLARAVFDGIITGVPAHTALPVYGIAYPEYAGETLGYNQGYNKNVETLQLNKNAYPASDSIVSYISETTIKCRR